MLVSASRVDAIRGSLDAAGADWEVAANQIPEVDRTQRGDTGTRDLVCLNRPWGMLVNGGTGIAICPGVLYRTESGEWHAQGWSKASAAQLHRPRGVVYDEDAGVWVPASRCGGL